MVISEELRADQFSARMDIFSLNLPLQPSFMSTYSIYPASLQGFKNQGNPLRTGSSHWTSLPATNLSPLAAYRLRGTFKPVDPPGDEYAYRPAAGVSKSWRVPAMRPRHRSPAQGPSDPWSAFLSARSYTDTRLAA